MLPGLNRWCIPCWKDFGHHSLDWITQIEHATGYGYRQGCNEVGIWSHKIMHYWINNYNVCLRTLEEYRELNVVCLVYAFCEVFILGFREAVKTTKWSHSFKLLDIGLSPIHPYLWTNPSLLETNIHISFHRKLEFVSLTYVHEKWKPFLIS